MRRVTFVPASLFAMNSMGHFYTASWCTMNTTSHFSITGLLPLGSCFPTWDYVDHESRQILSTTAEKRDFGDSGNRHRSSPEKRLTKFGGSYSKWSEMPRASAKLRRAHKLLAPGKWTFRRFAVRTPDVSHKSNTHAARDFREAGNWFQNS